MNILHLSDIHFGRNDPVYGLHDRFADHDKILQGVIDTVTALSPELRPEHILFTGDIAWCGKSTEFAEALQWFRRLLDALGLEGKDVSFCVGNHDLDRDCCFVHCDINDNTVKEIDELYRYENSARFEASVLSYDKFCESLGVIPYRYPTEDGWRCSYSVGYKDVPFQSGLKLRIVAMNTSLVLQQKGIARDKMWLGRTQLTQLMDYGILPAPRDEIWCTAALFHHPERYLNINETVTYDDRSPTLHMLLDNADLLLCGHTESMGRPAFLRRMGGGLLLGAGATYYSDDHKNSFSMLYVSDRKRGAVGFLPYEYKNGAWQDYDMSAPDYRPAVRRPLPAEGRDLGPAVLQLQNASGGFSIRFKSLLSEQDGGDRLRLDSAEDFMNEFTLRYNGPANGSGRICLGVSPSWSRRADALARYNALSDFLAEGPVTGWTILNANGAELLSGSTEPDCTQVRQAAFPDRELLRTLQTIGFYFEVPIFVPETITEEDARRIRTLQELSVMDSTNHVITPDVIELQAGKEELETLAGLAGQPVYLRRHTTCSIGLFGVTIKFGKISVMAGPYTLDSDDLQNKLATFRPGDRRTAVFTEAPNHSACLVRGGEADDMVPPGCAVYETDALEFRLYGE